MKHLTHLEPEQLHLIKRKDFGVFPGGPVVKNLPCNAGEIGSIPGRGNKTPHAAEQLSLHTATTEHRAASRDSVRHSEDPVASAKTQHSQDTQKHQH